MSEIKLDHFRFSKSNPYIDPLQKPGERKKSLVSWSKRICSDASSPISAQAVSLIAKAFPVIDYEKQIDFAGFTAGIIDWGAFLPVVSLETIIIADSIAQKLSIASKNPSPILTQTLGLIRLPLCIVSVAMAAIEWIVEAINCVRTVHLIRKFDNLKDSPIKKLEWIKKNFFEISGKETRKICAYIEEKTPTISKEEEIAEYEILETKILKMRLKALKEKISPALKESVKKELDSILTSGKNDDPNIRRIAKAMHYHILEEKILNMRFGALKRRITPELADTVKTELDAILLASKSSNPNVQKQASMRAKELVRSIDTQAKNKVLVHLLGIAAITFALISGVVFLAGATAPVIFITLGCVSIAFIGAQYFLKKGTLAKEVEAFYNRVPELNWTILPFPSLYHASDRELTSEEGSEFDPQESAKAL